VQEVEQAGIVQEELAQLPERYRLPVVLCDLEGHTHAQAATALGWPVGSVSGRLSRARALLRNRLTQRGLAPAVGAALIVPAAGVPAGVVRAAIAAVSGSAAIPVSVSILTEGVLSAMRIAKLKLAAVVVLSAGLLALGGGTLVGVAQMPTSQPKGEPPPKVEAPPAAPPKEAAPQPPVPGRLNEPTWDGDIQRGAFPEIKFSGSEGFTKACPHLFAPERIPADPTDDTYRRLLKASLSESSQFLVNVQSRKEAGRFQLSDLPPVVQCLEEIRRLVTELWANEPKTLIPWLEELLMMAKYYEQSTQAGVEAARESRTSLNLATAYRLRVEAALWKAKNPKPAGR
jgi:hypothetical protein